MFHFHALTGKREVIHAVACRDTGHPVEDRPIFVEVNLENLRRFQPAKVESLVGNGPERFFREIITSQLGKEVDDQN